MIKFKDESQFKPNSIIEKFKVMNNLPSMRIVETDANDEIFVDNGGEFIKK